MPNNINQINTDINEKSEIEIRADVQGIQPAPTAQTVYLSIGNKRLNIENSASDELDSASCSLESGFCSSALDSDSGSNSSLKNGFSGAPLVTQHPLIAFLVIIHQ